MILFASMHIETARILTALISVLSGFSTVPQNPVSYELFLRERKQFYMSSKMALTMSLLKVKETRLGR